jgi:hypothetical protein
MEDTKVVVQAEGKVGSFFKINWDNSIGYVFSGLLEFELQVDSIVTG